MSANPPNPFNEFEEELYSFREALIQAIYSKSISAVKKLLDKIPEEHLKNGKYLNDTSIAEKYPDEFPDNDPKCHDPNYLRNLPLSIAIYKGYLDIADLLVQYGASPYLALINWRNKGDNIFYVLLKNGRLKTLQFLVRYPLLMSGLFPEKHSILEFLWEAACRGLFSVVTDIFKMSLQELMLQRGKDDENILFYVIRSGREECLKNILALKETKSCIDVPNAKGCTTTVAAILANNPAMVKLLLEAGSSLEKLQAYRGKEGDEYEGMSIMGIAASYPDIAMIKYLSTLPGIKEELRFGNAGLEIFESVFKKNSNYIPTFRFLFDNYAKKPELFSYRDEQGNSFLAIAASYGKSDAVKFLLQYEEGKALLQQYNKKGESPLILVIRTKHDAKDASLNINTVKMLLTQGAACSDLSRFETAIRGNNILICAINDNPAILPFLLTLPEVKVLLNVKNREGKSALYHAIISGEIQIAELLIQSGARIEDVVQYRDSDGLSIADSLVSPGVSDEVIFKVLEFMSKIPELQQLLIEADTQNRTLIVRSIFARRISIFKVMLAKYAMPSKLVTYIGMEGENIFEIILNINNPEMLDIFLCNQECRKWALEQNMLQKSLLKLLIDKIQKGSFTKMLDVLKKHGATFDQNIINYRDHSGRTVLILAYDRIHLYNKADRFRDMVYLLQFESIKSLLEVPDSEGETLLSIALLKGDCQDVIFLVKAGANITKTLTSTVQGRNRLELLLAQSLNQQLVLKLEYLLSLQEVQALLKASSKIELIRLVYNSFLTYYWSGSAEMFKKLFGLLFNEGSLEIPEDTVKLMLDFRDEEGNTLLLHGLLNNYKGNLFIHVIERWKIIFQQFPFFKQLISIRNHSGLSPIRAAIKQKLYSAITGLIEEGANVEELREYRSPESDNILHLFFEDHKIELSEKLGCLRSLLTLSGFTALLKLKNLSGKNVFQAVAELGVLDFAHFMLQTEKPAFIEELLNYRDQLGNTIIQYAILNDREEFACFLINNLEYPEFKRLIEVRNNSGETAFTQAVMHGREDAVSALLKANADTKYFAELFGREGGMKQIIERFAKIRDEDGYDASGIFKLLKTLLSIPEIRVSRERLLLRDKNYNEDLLILLARHSFGIVFRKFVKLLKEFSFEALTRWRSEEGDSILHAVICTGNISLVRYFFKLTDPHSTSTSYIGSDGSKSLGESLMNLPNANGETPIITALLHCKNSCLKILLQHRASCKEAFSYQKDGVSLLSYLVKNDEKEIPAAILSIPKVKDFFPSDADAIFLLIEACRNLNFEKFKMLLKMGAKLESLLHYQDKEGNSLLHIILSNNDSGTKDDFLRKLLFTYPDLKALFTVKNSKHQTPLVLAMFQNRISEAKYLVTLTSSEQLASHPGSTSFNLLVASVYDCISYEILECLVNEIRARKLFPEQFVINATGLTAAKIALLRGEPKIAELFGINLKDKLYIEYRFALKRSVLAEAIIHGYEAGVKNLLQIPEYRKVMAPNETGQTPLIEAAILGHAGIVALLEKNGAGRLRDLSRHIDLNGGNTIIHLACGKGLSDAGLRMLFQYPEFRQLINVENTAGETPLVIAAQNAVLFSLLLEYGANIEHKNARDLDVLKMMESVAPPPSSDVWKIAKAAKGLMELARSPTAKSEDDEKIIQFRREGGSGTFLQRDSEGNTPLHLAVREGNYFFINLLSSVSETRNAKNNRGHTPLQVIKPKARNAAITKAVYNAMLAGSAESEAITQSILNIMRGGDTIECSDQNGEFITKLKTEKTVLDEEAIDEAIDEENHRKEGNKVAKYLEAAIASALEIEDSVLRSEKLYEFAMFIQRNKESVMHFGSDKILEILSEVAIGTAVFGKARFEMAKICYELYQGLIKFCGKEAKTANERLRQAFEYIHQATDVKESEEFRKRIITACAGPLFQEQIFGDFSKAEDCLALIEKTVGSDEKVLQENEELTKYKLELKEELRMLEIEMRALESDKKNDKKRKRGDECDKESVDESGKEPEKRARTMTPQLHLELGKKRERSEAEISFTHDPETESEPKTIKHQKFA